VTARKKSPLLAAPFQGEWRIAEMDAWPDDAVDLLGPASLLIKGQEGEMRFIAVTAWLDIRYDIRNGGPIAEFSWEGVDEGDPRSGRGWLVPGTAGRLVGHIFIHNGDDSGFVCEPC
jgi:hypothetical protein